jgi:ribosome-binding ATPase YchF (GTP1/OBG family)
MIDAGDVSAGELLWQDTRERYEDPTQDLQALADELGLNKFKLVLEARRRGWKMRKSGKSAAQTTRATIQRFKELLQSRLALLETQINALGCDVSAANSEREIRAVNTLVRTLEKVLELERKDRSHRFKKLKERRDLNDTERDELVQRIANLRPRPDRSAVRDADGAGSGAISPDGLEKLGAA